MIIPEAFLTAFATARPLLPDLTPERVKRIWKTATWEPTDEGFQPIALTARHVVEVALGFVPEAQREEFTRISTRMIVTCELVCPAACTSASCPIVRATGKPAHAFVLIEDLFTTRIPRTTA